MKQQYSFENYRIYLEEVLYPELKQINQLFLSVRKFI
jgi:hypothetical protein